MTDGAITFGELMRALATLIGAVVLIALVMYGAVAAYKLIKERKNDQ